MPGARVNAVPAVHASAGGCVGPATVAVAVGTIAGTSEFCSTQPVTLPLPRRTAHHHCVPSDCGAGEATIKNSDLWAVSITVALDAGRLRSQTKGTPGLI